MEQKKTKVTDVQGTTNQQKRPSESYTVKRFGATIDNLIELKLVTKEEANVLREIQQNAINKYIQKTFH